MGLAIRVDEEVLAAVLQTSNNGTGVQQVMADEGGMTRIRMNTITGHQDSVAVDYGKIFAAQGQRAEFSAALRTHIPADMLSHDNDMEGPNGASQRPDLDLLKQFSPDYLLALEGVGESLELMLSGDLSPEAQQELSELLVNLANIKTLMELAAQPDAPAAITERLEQALETMVKQLDTLSQLTTLPQAFSDFALDVMAEAATLAPVSQTIKTAITRLETNLGRTSPPVERMTLSALMMGGRTGTNPLAVKARPAIVKAANNNGPAMSIISLAATLAAPRVQGNSIGQTVTNAVVTTANNNAVVTPQANNNTPTVSAPAPTEQVVPTNDVAPATNTPVEIAEAAAPAPVADNNAPSNDGVVNQPDDGGPLAVADNTLSPVQPETVQELSVPTPVVNEPVPTVTAFDDALPPVITPVTSDIAPVEQPTSDTDTVPADTPTPPAEIDEPILPSNDTITPPTAGPGSGGTEPAAEAPSNEPSSSEPPSHNKDCNCDQFNDMAKGKEPDTRNEQDFTTQYGQDLVNEMGIDGLRQMEAENNSLNAMMEKAATNNILAQEHEKSFNDGWAAISQTQAKDNAGVSRTENFNDHVCTSSCNHTNSYDAGVQAQAASAETKATRKFVL